MPRKDQNSKDALAAGNVEGAQGQAEACADESQDTPTGDPAQAMSIEEALAAAMQAEDPDEKARLATVATTDFCDSLMEVLGVDPEGGEAAEGRVAGARRSGGHAPGRGSCGGSTWSARPLGALHPRCR